MNWSFIVLYIVMHKQNDLKWFKYSKIQALDLAFHSGQEVAGYLRNRPAQCLEPNKAPRMWAGF